MVGRPVPEVRDSGLGLQASRDVRLVEHRGHPTEAAWSAALFGPGVGQNVTHPDQGLRWFHKPARHLAVRRASPARPSAVRPGQPLTSSRQACGMAEAPHRAPSSAPAMAAIVSVSSPIRTAA